MRNLKKILALVLALVMSLSLVTIAGASKYPDVEDTDYATAIDVLDALKVFIGYEDGTFQPKGELTRAEAAVLVYRIATGDVDAKYVDNYTDMSTKFNDLTGYGWAKGYINYCQNAGIVVGTSANTFSPGNKVTGYQLMVMVLRTLGYGKAGEFAAGSLNWELESASRCESLGMLDNILNTGNFGQPATREMTAEILFQGLLQNTVTYSIATSGGYTKDAQTLGQQRFGLEKVEGVLVANEYADIRRAGTAGNTAPESEGISVLRDKNGKDYRITTPSTLEDLGETHVAYAVKTDTRSTFDLTGVAMVKKYEDAEGNNPEVVYDDGGKLNATQFKTAAGNIDTGAERYINFGEANDGVDLTADIKITYEASEIVDTITARTASQAIAAFCEKYHLTSKNGDPESDLYIGASATSSTGVWEVYFVPTDAALIYYDQTKSAPAAPIAEEDYTTNVAKSVKGSGDEAGHVFSITEPSGRSETSNRNDDNLVYRVEIAPGSVYTSFDEAMVKSIFYGASTTTDGRRAGLWVNGAVYRGTQTVTDYSSDETLATFLKTYVDTPEASETSVTTNERGWWLKMVDNDADGYVDYIFQTRYTVAIVTSVADDLETMTLDTWDSNSLHNSDDAVNKPSDGKKITAYNYAGDETIEEGDVVLYATIDGKNYAWKADVVNGHVTNINRTAGTFVLDGTTYEESAVHEHSTGNLLYSGVNNMTNTINLNIYLDMYGNMAAFEQDFTGTLVLLLDGWAQTTKAGADYAVRVWEDGGTEEYDVVSGGGRFIDSRGNNLDDNNSVNSWNRVKPFHALNCIDLNLNDIRHGVGSNDYYYAIDYDTKLETDVAVDAGRLNTEAKWDAAVEEFGEDQLHLWDDIHTMVAYKDEYDEDGNIRLLPVDRVYDVEGLNTHNYVMIDILEDDLKIVNGSNVVAGNIYETESLSEPYAKKNAGEVNVRANANTTYYFVYNNSDSYAARSLQVHEETGYTKASDWLKNKSADIENIYAVGVENTGANKTTYYVATVVVVELDIGSSASSEVFVYNVLERDTYNGYDTIEVIYSSGTPAKLYVPAGTVDGPGFYTATNTYDKVGGSYVYKLKLVEREDLGSKYYYFGKVTESWDETSNGHGVTYAVIDPYYYYDTTKNEVVHDEDTGGSDYQLGVNTAKGGTYYEISRISGKHYDVKKVDAEDVLQIGNYVLLCVSNLKSGEGTLNYAVSFGDSEDTAEMGLWDDLLPDDTAIAALINKAGL